MNQSARAARAGLVLSCALFVLALPRPGTRPEPCLQPALRAAGEVLCQPARDGGRPRLEGPARRLFGLPIDPNRADARTLEALPGIGPARAGAIVAERSRRPFEDVADLERVPGIGPKTRRAIAPWVAPVGEAPPPQNR